MTKPRTTPPPVTATTTATRIDHRPRRPPGIVLPGGVAQRTSDMHAPYTLRIALVSTTLVCGISLSGQSHERKAPHGGIVADAGTRYIELVLMGNEARFFLLDTLGNTLPVEGLTGTAYVQYNDRTTANLEIAPYGLGYLRAMLPIPHSFTLVASVKLPGGFVSARFTGPPETAPPVEQHNASDGHAH